MLLEEKAGWTAISEYLQEKSAQVGRWPETKRAYGVRNVRGSLLKSINDQRDRWFLWYVVSFAAGIAAYFALPREPYWPVFATAVAAIAGLLLVYRHTGTRLRLVLAVFFLAGFVMAKARVDGLDTKLLPATTPTTQITGTVLAAERTSGNRTRIVLALTSASGIRQQFLPHKVRLSGKHPRQPLFYGDAIQLRARLFPLPGPVRPRGYDFGRALWFKGLGATGFYYGRPQRLSGAAVSSYHPVRALQQLRHLIGERISAATDSISAGLARALIIGDRSGIDKKTIQALRAAGLAHILAISGLHMSLVAGGSFWLLRALLALSGALVLSYPIKKWAAVGGIFTGLFYLAISGNSIATQRAFIMTTVMFVSILLDRPAISMRNVAVAALLILTFHPEALLGASFQMSFMAVTGLVAWFEFHRLRASGKTPGRARSPVLRWSAKSLSFFISIVITTIVAGLFTALPGAFHFHKIAVWSLPGNIVALPVLSLIVMPGAIITVLLMPLGLESLGLAVMSLGSDTIVAHARRVADLPGALAAVPDMALSAVLLMLFGLLWLCLWRGRLKFAAAAPLVLAACFLGKVPQPDILVSKFGRNVAVRNQDGFLVLADRRKSRFAAEHWLAASGDMATPTQSASRKGWSCKGQICTAMVLAKKIIWLKRKPYKRAGVAEPPKSPDINCKNYDVVISSEPLGKKCRQVLLKIDRFDLWRKGAHAVYFDNGNARATTALDIRGLRPWVVRPLARRKILTNPPPPPRYRQKPKPAGPKRQVRIKQRHAGNFL